jgi:Type III restriction enzyme, res subunit
MSKEERLSKEEHLYKEKHLYKEEHLYKEKRLYKEKHDSAYLNKISNEIADRYGLIPREVTQDVMMDYLKKNPEKNYVGEYSVIRQLVNSNDKAGISTMSICSYMNPYTPNKRLAILHSTGTGKTRKSLLAAMSYNRDITIVAVHSIQITPFANEMERVFDVKNTYPGFRKRVEVVTCKTVATATAKRDYDVLDYYFKDRVIIIDEMHHVKSSGEKLKSKREAPLFDSMVDMLRRYSDAIVFLLTATVLVDTASEIFGVYKLLKGKEPPEDEISPYNIAESLSGYISELTQKNLRYKNYVIKCKMKEEGKQWELYQLHQNDKTSVHTKTSAVSRFVTENDGLASEYKRSIKDIINKLLEGMNFRSLEERNTACIEALKLVSIKMYKLVKYIQKNPTKPMLIYDGWKKRGGVDRLIEVLSMSAIGYSLVMSEQDAMDVETKPLKMLALHKLPQNRGLSTTVNKLRDIFNSEGNRQGRLIHLIIVTPKYSESMSILNAFSSHTLNMLWNITTFKQVQGRCNRKNSLSYLADDDPRKEIHNYSYVLYKPDGGETVESEIRNKARIKYEGISRVCSILALDKIENLFSSNKTTRMFPDPPNHYVNDRINYRIRSCSDRVNYRDIDVDVEPFLKLLEKAQSLFSTMKYISEGESGYTRLVNLAIKTLEHLYSKDRSGDSLTEKQRKALEDVSRGFITHNGENYHLFYVANSDTAEYQRFAVVEKRCLRNFNSQTSKWTDVKNQNLLNILLLRYYEYEEEFVKNVQDNWIFYGFYVVRYTLSSCYRLIKYKSDKDIIRKSSMNTLDRRKKSRGEKWKYYNKSTLINLLTKLCNINTVEKQLVVKKLGVEDIFEIVLGRMSQLGMVLELPF